MSGDQLPRRAYFQAADRAPLEPGSPARADQTTTATTRQQLAQNLQYKAEAVANAVKTLRAFDGTGHLPAAMPHLETSVQDLIAAHVALVESVTKFAERSARRDRMNLGLDLAVAVERGTPADAAGQPPMPAEIADHAAALQRSFGEPPLPVPKPGPDPYRVHRNYPG
jgi:hypothetical protein